MPRISAACAVFTVKRRLRTVIAGLLRHAGAFAEPGRFHRRICANKKLPFTEKISLC
jgi:hypothetical protein